MTFVDGSPPQQLKGTVGYRLTDGHAVKRRAVVRETSSQEAEETPHGRMGWSTKSSYKGSPLH
jgi:hypothetical protein